jgi:hypothetical protein
MSHARSAFQSSSKDLEKNLYVEQYHLDYACSQDFQPYTRAIPCHKCRIIPAVEGQILTLIAADKAGIEELKTLVQSLDKPAEQIIVSFCCVLVQEHHVAPFLKSLLQHPQSFYKDWREGLVNLASEMTKNAAVLVLATPKIHMQAGRSAKLCLQDEALVHQELRALENYGIALNLNISCLKRGDTKFLIDVDFSHQLFVKSQGAHDPKQRKELKTQITLSKGEAGFLGSAGHFGLIQEEGVFNFLKIIPKKLWPTISDQRQINSELIVIVSLD